MRPASPSTPRFFVPGPIEEARLVLPREESRHVLRVLRLGVGDALTLFDGTNREFRGRIEGVEDRRAVVALEAGEVVDREATVALTLAVAVPKGRRLEDLVRACAELGTSVVVPIYTERTVVRERGHRSGRMERIQRVAVEAAKQCGRNRLTRIADPCTFEEHLALAPEQDVALLATTAEGTVPLTTGLKAPLRRGKILLTIGPEGGFSPSEIRAAISAGFRPVTLGRSRLRVATAAVAGVAMILALAARPADEGGARSE